MTRRSTSPETPIEPRNLSFDLTSDHPRHWHSDDPDITHFFNALSLMFPAGERFFMHSMRRFLRDIDDPQLRKDVLAFLAQEGFHSREHDRYNKAIRDQGYWTARWLELVSRLALDLTRRFTGSRWQLAITCGFEHLTATLADTVLRDPRVLRDAEAEYAALWRWHCVEETEHKAVAFDVYSAVAPGLLGYLRRALVMGIITINFFPYILVHQVSLAGLDDPLRALRPNPRALRFFWGTPGIIRQGIRSYLSYFHPRFHPWWHDNRELVDRWRAERKPPSAA
jgi:predicted metal-dependent hydrolase